MSRQRLHLVQQRPEQMIICGTDSSDAKVNILHCELREQIPLRIIDGIDRSNSSCIGAYLLEILGRCLFGNRDNEGMKAFTMLQKPVDVFVDEGRERSGQNTSESQRAMPEFTSALKPADKAAGRQCLARICDKVFIA